MALDIQTQPIQPHRGLPRVLDKYMLPRLAFVLVSIASLAGAILTGLRHGQTEWVDLAVRWSFRWVLALMLGAQMWKMFYLRPAVRIRPVPDAVDYGNAMLALYRRWEKLLLPIMLVLAFMEFGLNRSTYVAAQPWAIAAGMAMLLAVTGSTVSWRSPPHRPQQTLPSWLLLAGLAGLAASLAGLDVALQSGGNLWVLIPNRILHLWAFSAWLGGALWNIAIAVPTGIMRTSMDTVILANIQLERFRVVVRMVFPTIVLTGIVQTWAIVGWQWQALLVNWWGYLILAKVGLILCLVVIFITCPMWRACSPIRGVCDLDDLR